MTDPRASTPYLLSCPGFVTKQMTDWIAACPEPLHLTFQQNYTVLDGTLRGMSAIHWDGPLELVQKDKAVTDPRANT